MSASIARRPLGAIAAVLVAIALGGCDRLNYKRMDDAVLKDSLHHKITSLSRAHRDGTVLGAVFLPDRTLNDAFDYFEDRPISLRIPATETIAGEVLLKLSDIEISNKEAVTSISFQLEATSEFLHTTAYLEAKADLLTDVVEGVRDQFDRVTAEIRISPREIRPSLRFRNIEMLWEPSSFSQLIADVAIGLSHASLGVKVPATFKNDLRMPFQEAIETKIGEPNKYSRFSVSVSGDRFFAEKSTLLPLPIAGGIWVLAISDTANGGDPNQNDIPAKVNEQTYRSELAALLGDDPARGSTSLFIHKNLFERYLRSYIQSNGAGRKIRIQMTAYEGDWYEDKWRDKNLGEGGIKVYPRSQTSIHAEIGIKPSSFSWSKERGLSYELPFDVEATAPLTVHIDPLIGGGFPIDITLHGAIQKDPVIAGSLMPMLKKGPNGRTQLELRNTPECLVSTATIKTGGEIPVGIEVPVQVGNLLKKSIRADLNPKDARLEVSLGDLSTTTIPVNARIELQELAITDNGLLATAEFSKSYPDGDAPVQEEPGPVSEPPGNSCPPGGSIKLTVGDLEFGKNNEIVKLFRALLKVADNAKEAAKKFVQQAPELANKLSVVLTQQGDGNILQIPAPRSDRRGGVSGGNGGMSGGGGGGYGGSGGIRGGP